MWAASRPANAASGSADAVCQRGGQAAAATQQFQAQPEGQLLAVHAAHALQAPVRRQDEQAGLHQAGQHGRARPDRERLELGLAERGSHEHQSKPLVDRRVNFRCRPMASLLVRALLVLVCGFAALSSSVAAALGLEEERILAFTGLVSVLLLLPFLYRPRLSRPSGPVLLLAAPGHRHHPGRPRRQLRSRRRQDRAAGAGAAGRAQSRPVPAGGGVDPLRLAAAVVLCRG